MFQSSYDHEIFRNYYQWQKWCPCKRSRSKVKVTKVKTLFSRFQTVTPVWIYIWNDRQSLMLLRRCPIVFQGHPWNFKVTQLNKKRILTQIVRFCNSSLNSLKAWCKCLKQHRSSALLNFKLIRQISRSHWTKNRRFWPKLSVSGL